MINSDYQLSSMGMEKRKGSDTVVDGSISGVSCSAKVISLPFPCSVDTRMDTPDRSVAGPDFRYEL